MSFYFYFYLSTFQWIHRRHWFERFLSNFSLALHFLFCFLDFIRWSLERQSVSYEYNLICFCFDLHAYILLSNFKFTVIFVLVCVFLVGFFFNLFVFLFSCCVEFQCVHCFGAHRIFVHRIFSRPIKRDGLN